MIRLIFGVFVLILGVYFLFFVANVLLALVFLALSSLWR